MKPLPHPLLLPGSVSAGGEADRNAPHTHHPAVPPEKFPSGGKDATR